MAQFVQDSGPAIPLAELPLTAEEVERARLVDFGVDRDAELPVGTQLGWKIRGMIVRGVLRPGDRVPSVRALAEFADVNVNTARAVYRGLEADGLISSEHGKGTFVTAAAGELRELETVAAEAAAAARGRGLDPRALAAAIYSDPGGADEADPVAPFPEIDPGLDSRELRRALREQIGRLESEIATYAWHDPAAPPPPRPRGGEPVGRVVDVEELERTRAELIDRLRRLRGEAAQRGAREDASKAYLEAMVGEPEAHRWEMVSSADTGEAGCKSWRVVPAWGPVGAIMGWWRVKVSSGCPLAGPLAADSGQHQPGPGPGSRAHGQSSSRADIPSSTDRPTLAWWGAPGTVIAPLRENGRLGPVRALTKERGAMIAYDEQGHAMVIWRGLNGVRLAKDGTIDSGIGVGGEAEQRIRGILFAPSGRPTIIYQSTTGAEYATHIAVGEFVPPFAVIERGPSQRDPSRDRTPTFRFSSEGSGQGTGFSCSVDGEPVGPCTSPTTIGPLTEGEHEFRVLTGADGDEADVRRFLVDTDVEDPDITTRKRQRQKGRNVKVKSKAVAQEPITAIASGRVVIRRRGKSNPKFPLEREVKSIEAGRVKVLRQKLERDRHNRRVKRALRKGKHKVRAPVKVEIRDRAGNQVAERRVVRLKWKR